MGHIYTILKLTLIIFVGACSLLYIFQEKLIFFPTATPAGNRKAFDHIKITIPHNNITLVGWLFKSPNADHPFIIYYGGNAEEASANLYDIDNFGDVSLLCVNYRGYGDSDGQPTEKNLFADALYIFDYVVEKEKIAPENIILLGRSLGSGVATYVAASRKVRAVILVTPFDSLENMAKDYYPIFPVRLLLKHKFKSLQMAKEINVPLLAILAERDTIVPSSNSENLLNNWLGPVKKVVIKNAGHNDLNNHKTYWQAIRDFLNVVPPKTLD